MSCAAEALDKTVCYKLSAESVTGILAATVTVKDSSFEFAVLLMQLFYGVDTEFFLHVVTHFQSDDLAVETVKDWRNIELSVRALNFSDIGQKFLQRCISRQAFYDYLERKGKPWKYQPLADAMLKIHDEDEENADYGRARMYQALRYQKEIGKLDGIKIPCEATARNVMERINLIHKPKRKPNGITKADREARKSDDLLKRDFTADAPLKKCVTDITEIKAKDGKLYVSAIFDCYDLMPNGLAMADHMRAELLLGIIGKSFHDGRFLRLIQNVLKAGYIEDWKYNKTISGTPQGGIVSPILANIYLNEFDNWIEKAMLEKYNTGKRKKSNPEYNKFNAKIAECYAKGDVETANAVEDFGFFIAEMNILELIITLSKRYRFRGSYKFRGF